MKLEICFRWGKSWLIGLEFVFEKVDRIEFVIGLCVFNLVIAVVWYD